MADEAFAPRKARVGGGCARGAGRDALRARAGGCLRRRRPRSMSLLTDPRARELDRLAGVASTELAAQAPQASARTLVLTVDFEDWHQLVLRRIGRADWCT